MSGVGRSSGPDHPPFGACGRGPLLSGCGWGGCGRRDPSPTPQRALLRAGLARCAGCTRAPRGGRLLPGCGPTRVGRSPTPDHSSFLACGWGPLPTGCWCGGCGHEDPSPTPHRTVLRAGLARCGGGTKAPGGVASCLGVGLPGSGAFLPPTTSPLGRAAGAHYPLAVGAGAAGAGTRQQPHSARSCELALHVWGRHEGAPGRRILPGCGASGVGRSPTSYRPSFGACGWGLLPTGCGCGVTNPTARALACSLGALWGRHEGAWGGRLLPGCGASGVGRSPSPDHLFF